MITVRPATYEDIVRLDGQPPARTCRAMVAEEDGRVTGIWGFYTHNTRYVLFSSFSPEFRRHKRNFVIAVKSAREMIASQPPMPVIAVADPDIEGSDVLLTHMGFTQLDGSLYQWPGYQ
ncbi:hypothetical protein K0U83_08315 [bacterium]|jgi:hypothetical protein|nr:hypothetical protein [bacterium]